MANPTPYSVSYSFSGFQSSSPTTPLPAPALDNELANAAASSAAVISALADIRRSDGALKNGIVTFDSFEPGLQLEIDPTNGQLVAAAVAGAQASATAAAGSATTATTEAGIATTQAVAAAASASSVNLSLFLAKANNLAGLGSNTTALANIGAADVAGLTAVGRWAPKAVGNITEDFNAVLVSGWSFGDPSAVNTPVSGQYFLLETIGYDGAYSVQKAYPFTNATGGATSSVTPYRRFSYDSGGGVAAWTPWESDSPVPVGSTIWINDSVAPPGFLKENGALLSRAAFPRLAAFALASTNLVSEATWMGGSTGAFSTGDLATTFRLPDSRGEFIRNFDDGRGIDSGRTMGSHQADSLKDHTHPYTAPSPALVDIPGGSAGPSVPGTSGANTGSPSTGAAAETRPRNNVKLACIKW